jgi:hypothetical protein
MGNEDLGMRNAGMQEEDEEVGESKVMGDASLPAGCVKLCGGAWVGAG